ncbi:hypothetical protein FC093_21390 [Ilyomonas limi]|uniref:Uncharacterized protein n=1 Tax=Ilyomonas limi TaxID=2575867 RepID=A0A4U3KRR4_9BACT|nr:hypothetical protein [Ilyomonas limi]TKK64931.1 hypothetical protein FC093_21390 [Ilyomonas limi]
MEVYSEKSFLDFFKALIRYLASGFIFIIVFEYLRHDTSIWSFTKDNANWTLILVAAICGILIYAIHAAFLDDLFYRVSLWWLVRINGNKDFYLPNEFKKTVVIRNKIKPVPLSEVMFNLTTYRYLREGDKKEDMMGIQNRLDQLLALLVFLYTSCYSLILLPIAFAVKNFYQSNFTVFTVDKDFYLIELLGIFLLISGFALDLKITKRELFIVKKMEEENKTVANNTTL